MRPILLAAGWMALAFACQASAKPGNGHGNPHAYGYGAAGPVGYGHGGCPPGLAKKAIPCVPPGQAKKLYNVGQRFPLGYGSPLGYSQIPYDLRSQYGLNPYGNYYYGDGYIYRVNPRTMLIQQVVNALLYR